LSNTFLFLNQILFNFNGLYYDYLELCKYKKRKAEKQKKDEKFSR